MNGERGFSLLEALIAGAVVAIGALGVLAAWNGVARYARAQAGPNETAALALAQQTLRVARDAWKYGAPGTAPAGSWSVAGAHPMTVTAGTTPSADGAAISVTVTYTPDPGRSEPPSVSVSADAPVLAPLPGTRIDEPSPIPQPGGAP